MVEGVRMKKSVSFAGLLTLCVLLAACGGKAGAPSTLINVTMTDFQFTPNSFTVPAGQQINFTATNDGNVEHSFAIMKLGSEVNTNFSDKDQANVFWEQTSIPAGQDVNATFTAPNEPGEYQIVCAVHGHIEAGMVGKLSVINPE
jgi:uncharacterized cupredoxin-like copper-binding protein